MSESLRQKQNKNWGMVPQELRARAIAHLRANIHPDDLKKLRDLDPERFEDWIADNHFFAGMAVRNMLREVIKDDELPPVKYPEGSMRNWDDYYAPALEEAAASTNS